MTHFKIATVIPSLRGDGAVAMMLRLANGFRQAGHPVDLLVARAEGEQSGSIPEGVRLLDLGARRSTLAVPALCRYLRRERPEILVATEHFSGLPALYAQMLARTETRCVIRQDNTWSMDSKRFHGRHKLVTPWVVGRLFRRAEIIAVSKDVATDFASHFPRLANNIQTIYNPVIGNQFHERACAPVGHPWLAQDGEHLVVAVGRLTAAKGFDLLVDAFARVALTVPARLLILGEGPDRAALEAQIRARGIDKRCQLLGFLPNPLAFVSRARAFVLSSRFEGLPTVLIEALAAGAPVIAADCPSGPREILANGKYGVLVPPNDADALADAIIATLRSPPSRDGSLDQWLEQFSVETSVKQHLDLFAASLAAPPPQLRRAPLALSDIDKYQ